MRCQPPACSVYSQFVFKVMFGCIVSVRFVSLLSRLAGGDKKDPRYKRYVTCMFPSLSKGKGRPCTGTEARYRPYGPQGK